jgi:hypothetical protein
MLRDVKSTVARHPELADVPLLWRFYWSHRAVIVRLARTLEFDATTMDRALLEALQILLAHEDAHGDWPPASICLSFASEQWQRTVFARVERGRRIARRHFEMCVSSNLATGLKSGDIAIRGSDADYDEQLLPWSQCTPAVADYCSQLATAGLCISIENGPPTRCRTATIASNVGTLKRIVGESHARSRPLREFTQAVLI